MRWVLMIVMVLVSVTALADFPLPPVSPDFPGEVDPVIVSRPDIVAEPAPAEPKRHFDVASLTPSFTPGVYQNNGRYYRKRNGATQVYTNNCNGVSCSPGWYNVSAAGPEQAPVQAPAQAPAKGYSASGCSGYSASGCSGSNSGTSRGRRFFRGRSGCGG